MIIIIIVFLRGNFMLETAIITFREGLEMFLIVAITLAYLANTNRPHLKKPVYAGIAVALLLSATTGWHIAEMAEDPMTEGLLALTAGLFVATMTYTVMRAAKNIRQDINQRIEKSAKKEGMAAMLGIFVFTVVMIAREGMETAMMLGTLAGSIDQQDVIAGAMAGFLTVGIIGFVWVKQSHRINLRAFMQVTGLFLMLFCAHLFMYGFHELTEVGAVPLIDNFKWHTLTEPMEPGEPIGNLITIGLLVVPCLWLVYSYAWDKYIQPKIPAFAN